MINGISINKYIYNKLTACSALTSIVGEQIYPIIVEENGKFPFLVFTRRSVNVNYDNDGRAREHCMVVFSAVAKDYTTTVSILEAVRNLFELHGDNDVNYCKVISMEEGYYNNCYVQVLTLDFELEV